MASSKPTLPVKRFFNPMTLLTIAVFIAMLFSGSMAFSVSAAAPAEGTVVEGVSVPGVALGDTRAMVEAAYGQPYYCSGTEQSLCQFYAEGGGTVSIQYYGPDGGYATGSPDDSVYYIRWYQAVSGWVTTAGINTTLAYNDLDAVLAAYPNAIVSHPSFFDTSVDDSALGIHIDYHTSYPNGTTSVWMAISFPAPPEEHFVRVSAIDLWAVKRSMTARVQLHDDLNLYSSGASVFASWTLADGSQIPVSGISNSSGLVYLTLDRVRHGAITFTIEDVVFEGFTFDPENSVLSASIYVK
jgi:hypothetical protein